MKSGNLNFLEPPGPLQASNETVLPFTDTKEQTSHIFDRGQKWPEHGGEKRHVDFLGATVEGFLNLRCVMKIKSNLGAWGGGERKITECVPCKVSRRCVDETLSIFWDVRQYRSVFKLATFQNILSVPSSTVKHSSWTAWYFKTVHHSLSRNFGK